MTKINEIEARDQELQANLEHYHALLRTLAPDPGEWTFTGEVLEGHPAESRCACGHPIKWIFIIERRGETKHLGSTCITHFESINQETFIALCQAQNALSARLAKAERKMKAAAADEKVTAAKAEFLAALSRAHALYDDYRQHRQQAPRRLWEVCASRTWAVSDEAPDYQRPADFIRWYHRQTTILMEAMR